ncbi:glucose 1-dehydrogenase [Alkalicoccus urumqiensis]|uniref:Oxidoreductase n=1 Tax=Alkalicoccus urumqiensis TaxID=1548213 RepID=A0A2P6MGF3_ALKUR|nr:glucose 1-dehydrogenase [Alkalicoccus urumqiensis]PRO65351.1 oxidoreductase [Alkalicoccus urumqiensis]
MKRLENKVILITGGASGLGLAAAEKAAEEGASLFLVDMNEEKLQEAAEKLKQHGTQVEAVKADVTNEEEVKQFVETCVSTFGRIDGFFNNAGIEGKQNLTEDYGTDEFAKVVDVNLNGVFYGMKYVLKEMKKQGAGSIVNAASVGGIRGVGSQSGYAASKHGVVGLTRNSGVEYGEFNVRINAIAPGAIMTDMVRGSLKQMAGDDWESFGEQFVQANPSKRFGKPEEVGALVVFLLSDESTFINGSVITIDGGQSAKY